jgi:hypothetical protein
MHRVVLTRRVDDDLSEPQEVLTFLDRMEVASSRDADDVRLALVELVESGDAWMQRGARMHLSVRADHA